MAILEFLIALVLIGNGWFLSGFILLVDSVSRD